jgi:transcriptional regulator with XRE-family HTH domain
MMELATEAFTDWFNKLLLDNDLGVREAARKIGISHPMVSDMQNGARPTEGSCAKIAIAFNYSADYVLALAGYRSYGLRDKFIELIDHLAMQLPDDEEKNGTAEYIRMRLRLIDERGKYETVNPKKPKKSP